MTLAPPTRSDRPPRSPHFRSGTRSKAHADEMRSVHLRSLFDADAARGERYVSEAAGLYIDYSKHRITDETLERLFALARATRLPERIEAMFRGDRINVTENRPVLHVALRAPRSASIMVDGRNVVDDVHAVLDRMAAFANRVRSGAWTGHTGKRIRSIVNIGIGGSDLGPAMAYEALRFYSGSLAHLPLRVQRGRCGFRREDARPRSGGDAVHRRVEDVHDARDDDERALGPRVAADGVRRRAGGREALRGGVHQRVRGAEVRHRHREHVRLLGLGRRPVLHGIGDRPVDDDRDRSRPVPRDARGIARDGRALPHGAARARTCPRYSDSWVSGTATSSMRRPSA